MLKIMQYYVVMTLVSLKPPNKYSISNGQYQLIFLTHYNQFNTKAKAIEIHISYMNNITIINTS